MHAAMLCVLGAAENLIGVAHENALALAFGHFPPVPLYRSLVYSEAPRLTQIDCA